MQTAFDRARQLLQETRGDRRTRTNEGFQSIERDLPRLASPLDIPWTQNISSYLGSHNPLASHLDPKTETVWLLDNTAYRPIHPYPHAQQPWQAEYRAAFFKKDSGRDISKIVADIADKIGLKEGSGEEREKGERTIAERLQPFVDVVAPARWVDVKMPHGKVKRLGPGGRSATAQQTCVFEGEFADGDVAETTAVNEAVTPLGPAVTRFADPEGWMVISDIDDTIKITLTPSPTGILRTTFLLPPSPTPAMPAFYTHLHTTLSHPTWFYLSASPYNLHPFLTSFLHANFPPGTVLLRDASWMDLGGFLKGLTQGTEAYKRERMERLHGMLPRRKVVCVGDSTQSDPEAYGDVCRMYKGWVRKIFIRKVVDVAEMDVREKNSEERFERAFRGVERDVWRVFERPEELYEAVEALKGT